MPDSDKCRQCEFNARQFYKNTDTIEMILSEIEELKATVKSHSESIDTFKQLRTLITGSVKTLWAIAGLVAMVAWEFFSNRFLK